MTLGHLGRLLALLAIVWSFAGPAHQYAMVAGAAPPPQASGVVYQESGFAVADGPIASYFAARGGVRTFGPPVSHAFPLLGEQVQIFRDFVLKVDANGSVSTVNLFAMGGIPFRNVGGRIIPDVDQALVTSAPVPGTPDYEARVLEFIKTNAPDQWEGKAVGFHKAFAGTVQYEDAFPSGGNRALLSGFAQEVWGVPVSRPAPDAQNPDIVLLRWERGVMAWNSQTGAVTAIPLGEAFKAVLTGQGLGPERAAAAAGSQFLLQFDPATPDGVARPGELPNTVLATAFQPGAAAVNAAQLANNQYWTPTPLPGYQNPYGAVPTYQQGYFTPTATPYYQPSNPATGYPNNPGATGQSGVVPNTAGMNQQPGSGMPGAPAGAPTGSDPCYGDEQITFAPEQPRVANEVLIAVTSSRPHPYGRLAGTERTQFMRERPGQLGYVWEWTVMLSYPGQHEYTFYVDSTIPCKKIQLSVMESLATKTPRPTKTPTPYGWNNNNNNNNSNSNNNNANNNNSNGTVPYRDPYQFANVTYDAYNCSFFYSQGEAQRVLRANPSDPNRLDAEDNVQDGIACTTHNGWQYPSDGDYNPVQRTGTTTPTTGNQAPRITPSTYLNQGDAYNCNAFQSQYNAQSVLRADPLDPNRLDTEDNSMADGVACTNFYYSQYPYDTDYNAVSRGTVTPGTPQATFTPTPGGTPTATPTFSAANYIGKGDFANCVDFASQADAQAVLRLDPNDPNKLDISSPSSQTTPDGIACNSAGDAPEWSQMFYYPEPYNKTPVPTPNGGRGTGYTPTPASQPGTTSTPTPQASSKTPIATFQPSP